MKKYKLVVKTRPIPWKRTRRSGNRYFLDEKESAYRDELKYAWIHTHGYTNLEGALIMDCTFTFAPPKSWSDKKKKRAINGDLEYTTYPDIDNLGKCVKDALNKIAYKDDRQIVRSVNNKIYSDEDRVCITIYEVGRNGGTVK